ncbi:hypothetical protein [Pseudomonas chlororaphis]|uniref:hypothetical protein n=1 Tax=Pseudomonas chlororaphis TaxID=587753 RepID=UPI0024085045|nr:hypothetical protein [Pseudomonas chlororaphis]
MSKRKTKTKLDAQDVMIIIGGFGAALAILAAIGRVVIEFFFNGQPDWLGAVFMLAFVLGAIITIVSACSFVDLQEPPQRKSKAKEASAHE